MIAAVAQLFILSSCALANCAAHQQDPKVLQAFREFNVELFTVESVLFYLDAKHYATVRWPPT